MIQKRVSYYSFILLAVIAFSIPILTKNEYYLGLGIFISIHTVLILSLAVCAGFAGLISIGQAAFMGFGSYVTAILTTRLGISPLVGLPAALTCSAVVALLIGYPTVKLKGHYIAMATLAIGAVFSVVVKELDFLTGGIDGIINIPRIAFFGYAVKSDRMFYYFAWSICIVCLIISYHLVKSRTGRALRAIAGSEEAAESLGIDAHKYKLYIFILSAVLASVSGWLYAHFVSYISPPSFSPHFSVIILAITVISSMRSIGGAVIGGILLTILPELLRAYEDFETIIYGAIMMSAAMFFPDGIALEGERLIKKLFH